MKCAQLTRTKYAPVMGMTIRRRNEHLIAINASTVSHLTGLPSFGGGFLPFRSVSSNTLRAIASPHVKYARSGRKGFRQYRTMKREKFCRARTPSLCFHGGDVQGDVPRGRRGTNTARLGLKRAEEDEAWVEAVTVPNE